jgi:Protein of unknown function DUF262
MVTRPEDDEEDKGERDEADNPDPPLVSAERDITKLEIDVKEDPFQISAIIQKIDRKQLILTPAFQRKEVWKLKQRSEFIESILLNYPLPPLYLNQDREGRYIVVDGLQRSSSIYRFCKNEFALKELGRLTWLNGLTFSDLHPVLQSRIEDRKLLCYVLRPSVPLNVVYDIFARINRGGTPLNRQEIRHGLYQGKSTELLSHLVADDVFAAWLGRRLQPTRMGDEEAALRCIAFARVDPDKDYQGDMDKFLQRALDQLNGGTDGEIERTKQDFARVFSSAQAILGDDAFRIPTDRSRGFINLAIMESVYRFFASHPDDWLYKNKKTIAKNYAKLIGDPSYLHCARSSTGDTAKVKDRFCIARETLGKKCAD